MNERISRRFSLFGAGLLLLILAACNGGGVGPHTLTVDVVGNGSGTVTSEPEGISANVGDEATAEFSDETVVTLTAQADAGSSFDGWSGACTGATNQCDVTMDDAKSVTATFSEETVDPEEVTLTVSTEGAGSGTVTSDTGGIDCGTECTATYEQGTDVVLTATPDAGSVLSSWGGACGGQGETCTVTMDQDQTVTATFEEETTGPFVLTVSTEGSGAGSVTSDPAGIDCPGDCDEEFAGETDVTLTAAQEAGSNFTGWSGACSGLNTECTVTMNSALTATATFEDETAATTETFQIVEENDDAEEFGEEVSTTFPAGSVQVDSSDLDLGYDVAFSSSTTVGLRYAGVTIPQGATITSATLTFTTDATGAGTPTYTFEGQAADDAAAFEFVADTGNNDITNRDRTTAQVDWEVLDPWGATEDSPDLASVVQEIVDRDGWVSGNALALIISSANADADNYRVADSYAGGAGSPPELTITYHAPGADL